MSHKNEQMLIDLFAITIMKKIITENVSVINETNLCTVKPNIHNTHEYMDVFYKRCTG